MAKKDCSGYFPQVLPQRKNCGTRNGAVLLRTRSGALQLTEYGVIIILCHVCRYPQMMDKNEAFVLIFLRTNCAVLMRAMWALTKKQPVNVFAHLRYLLM